MISRLLSLPNKGKNVKKEKCYETVVLKMESLKYFKLHKEEYDFFPPLEKSFYTVTAQHVFMALEYLKQKWKQTNKNPKIQPDLNYLLTQLGISYKLL